MPSYFSLILCLYIAYPKEEASVLLRATIQSSGCSYFTSQPQHNQYAIDSNQRSVQLNKESAAPKFVASYSQRIRSIILAVLPLSRDTIRYLDFKSKTIEDQSHWSLWYT